MLKRQNIICFLLGGIVILEGLILNELHFIGIIYLMIGGWIIGYNLAGMLDKKCNKELLKEEINNGSTGNNKAFRKK